MKCILITGAAGFLGSHLAENYLNENYTVIGLDNFLTGQQKNIDDLKHKYETQFHFFNQDVCSDLDHLQNFIQKNKFNLEFIFHFASVASVPHYQKYSLETMSANSQGLKNCLSLALTLNAEVIFASTSEIYGDPLVSPQSENYFGNVNTYGPRSCYDESKRFGESLIYSWNQKHNTHHGIVRIFNTYGPRMHLEDGRVIIRLLQQSLCDEPITIYGNGTHTRSFCYVDDLICGISLYAQSRFRKPINLGRSETFTILEIANFILKITSSKSQIIFSELPVDDPKIRVPDLKLAEKEISYVSKINLESGLQKTIHWLKNERAL